MAEAVTETLLPTMPVWFAAMERFGALLVTPGPTWTVKSVLMVWSGPVAMIEAL